MEVTDQYVKEYRTLYRKHFGRDADPQTTRTEATKLLELMRVLYEPMGASQEREFIEKFSYGQERRKIIDGINNDSGGDVKENTP